ncbi:MAG: response regulator [Candidatus Omnitrophica bacterium]|nr:response regulator [Candidatus Omnitrophota bacterium]
MEIPRILIVDDEKDVRANFATFLSKRITCEIIEKGDGKEVLDLIEREEFHVILLDQHMPGIDGFTILERLRQKASRTTVIVITGLGGAALSHKVERLGGIYMAKPVSLKALQLIIERELDKRGGCVRAAAGQADAVEGR